MEVQARLEGLVLKNLVAPRTSIMADINSLRFILRNLLTNSVKFTSAGSITVDAVFSPRQIVISVEDTGIGMPPDIVGSLFQGGKKISRRGLRSESGSGSGLSLVMEFVEKMNGISPQPVNRKRGASLHSDYPSDGSSVSMQHMRSNIFFLSTFVEKMSVKKD